MNRQKVLVERVIYPAIRGQNCPICLNQLHHRRSAVIGACKHALSNFTFITHPLPPLVAAVNSRHDDGTHSRVIRRRARSEFSNFNSRLSRSNPLPWRRQFGRPGSVPPQVIAERKLQWRASVYSRGLLAVPIGSSRNSFDQGSNNCAKERIRQRMEPWIQRELRALLGDLDTSVIVHVATSLLISSLEKRLGTPSRQHEVEDEFLAPLRPFLHDRTKMFWHELRCFEESLLTMETYDAVVEYRILR
ncbi:hypothetical protein ACFE04_013883 [Oxalis oulophora]